MNCRHFFYCILSLLFFVLDRSLSDDDLEYLCKNIEAKSATLRVKRHLFCDYDNTVRPSYSHETATNVTVQLIPRFIEYEDSTSTLSLHTAMYISWTDLHLTWDADAFEKIKLLRVLSGDLWVPDISVFNSGDLGENQNGLPSTICLLESTGNVSCVSHMKYVTKCLADYTLWPFDKHVCSIRLGSWSYAGEEINFFFKGDGYSMDEYTPNRQWNLQIMNASKIVSHYSCCPNDSYPSLFYNFYFNRNDHVIRSVYLVPAVAMMVITITVMWLDSRSTERLAVASLNFICHLLGTQDLHWILPPNGPNAPNILIFYANSLAIATFALILTTLLRKLHDISIPQPKWISTTMSFVLQNPAGRFLILSEDSPKNDGGSNEDAENNADIAIHAKNEESSWKHFASLIEWLSFFGVLLAYAIMLMILLPESSKDWSKLRKKFNL